jgi:hypothetical protein
MSELVYYSYADDENDAHGIAIDATRAICQYENDDTRQRLKPGSGVRAWEVVMKRGVG